LTHYLSTIRNADLILVLEDGAIVERGTHNDPVARGRRSTALVHSQDEPLAVGHQPSGAATVAASALASGERAGTSLSRRG
jgi:hypothetical protein